MTCLEFVLPKSDGLLFNVCPQNSAVTPRERFQKSDAMPSFDFSLRSKNIRTMRVFGLNIAALIIILADIKHFVGEKIRLCRQEQMFALPGGVNSRTLRARQAVDQ